MMREGVVLLNSEMRERLRVGTAGLEVRIQDVHDDDGAEYDDTMEEAERIWGRGRSSRRRTISWTARNARALRRAFGGHRTRRHQDEDDQTTTVVGTTQHVIAQRLQVDTMSNEGAEP